MITFSTQLSPARCHQLREGGILRLMVQFLHEHTFEPHYQSEENTNIESFLENFNRKSGQRQRLSREIRMIVENTAKDANELKFLDYLEAVRDYTENLYRFLTNVPESKPKVRLPREAIEKLCELLYGIDNENCITVELFGGVYVALDLLRAQRRFFAKFQDRVIYMTMTGEDLLNEPGESKKVRNFYDRVLYKSIVILNFLSGSTCIGKDMKSFLMNSRSFNQLLVDTMEHFPKDDLHYLSFFDHCSTLIIALKSSYMITHRHPYAIICGLIRCITNISMNMKDPEIQSNLIVALDWLLYSCRDNILEFCSITGSIKMLIDFLMPNEKMGNDAEKAEFYIELKSFSVGILLKINTLWSFNAIIPAIGRNLLEVYESRNIVSMLAPHIKQITSTADHVNTKFALTLLKDVLENSKNQRKKFPRIDGALNVIRKLRLYNSKKKNISELANQILKLY